MSRGKHIPERLLRHIWSRQGPSSSLTTTDGRHVRVDFPGVLNDDGGPDFRGARISIGGISYRGDVELHRHGADWYHHRHHQDPRYNSVILHVVFDGMDAERRTMTHSGRVLPTIVLQLRSLEGHLRNAIRDERSYRRIPCWGLNDAVGPDVLRPWLVELARQRLEAKILVLKERLRELASEGDAIREPRGRFGVIQGEGPPDEIPQPEDPLQASALSQHMWKQVFYEGLMDGLGYSKNRRPFVRLARTVTIDLLESAGVVHPDDFFAILFGASGLGPAEPRRGNDLAERWNILRNSLRIETLQRADWQLFPTRPANHPAVRLRAAAVLLRRITGENLLTRVMNAVEAGGDPPEQRRELRELLCVRDEGIVVLGASRAMDLIANSVIPLALVHGEVLGRIRLVRAARALYETFPPLSDNAVLRTMREQLLKDKLKPDSLILQQGALHLFHYYCSDRRCTECEVGKRVFTAEM